MSKKILKNLGNLGLFSRQAMEVRYSESKIKQPYLFQTFVSEMDLKEDSNTS